jgi:predicted Ser/Thr protein kinase
MFRGEGSASAWSGEETSGSLASSLHRTAADSDQLTRGTIVGRYTVLSLIGRGGMSEVYGAYDPALDRKVALKVLQRGSGGHHRQQSRLHREARAIAQISHPNVIAVHEVGTFGDRVFIAIEFIEGRTLHDWLAERPRSRREILAAFADAARGLDAAHAKGLIHRDFKPHNVLIGNDGIVRVTDFGLVRWIDEVTVAETPGDPPPRTWGVDLTKTGQRVGTPRYMAPEQLNSSAMDARTDQFSFCVALYEALYGQHPFFARGETEPLAAAVRAGELRALSARSSVPLWQRRAILRGLSVAPADRWPSMTELVSALTTDPIRKRQRWFALGAALFGILAAGGALRARAHTTDAALCQAGQSRLDGIWTRDGRGNGTDARRSAVRAAFLTTGLSTAAEVWDHTSALLDRYADEWLRMDRDSCEATRTRHEQSIAVMNQRSACLEERRGALRALVDVLATADAKMMPRAVDAAIALPALDLCADPSSLHMKATPGDPSVRARVDDLRRRALIARAQHDAGRDNQAIAEAKALLAEARAVGYGPLTAELLALVGVAESAI